MNRSSLTLALAGAALLTAALVPNWRVGGLGGGAPQPPTPDLPLPPEARPTVPTGVGALRVDASLDQGSILQGAGEDRYLVVEVIAPELQGDLRRPVSLAVVMDVSGSMAARGKMENARMAAAELVDLLRPEDRFSLVTFSDRAKLLAPSGPVDAPQLKTLIQGIKPAGGTNLWDGLEMGLSQLRDPAEEAVKRVVILSDGMANIGVTQPAELVRQAGSLASEGVTVSALGLGLEFNEDLLAAMGDAGGGSYRFVDRPGQLAELFTAELRQMTSIAGRAATVDLKLPPGVEVAEIYGYTGSRDRDGYHVFLGDIHGGETRKIVARVHVPDRDLGPVSIADVSLRYADPDSGDGVSTGDRVVATITPDPGQARASVDRGVARKAVQARSAQLLDAGARAWQDGDLLANQARIQEAEDLLTEASVSLGDAGLGEQAAHYASQRGAFAAAPASSEAGNYQLKKSKEEARADSR